MAGRASVLTQPASNSAPSKSMVTSPSVKAEAAAVVATAQRERNERIAAQKAGAPVCVVSCAIRLPHAQVDSRWVFKWLTLLTLALSAIVTQCTSLSFCLEDESTERTQYPGHDPMRAFFSAQIRSLRSNDDTAGSPCVSKCLSSATRAAETFEVRALQRHRNLHRQKTLSGGHACGLEHLIGLTYHGENYLIKMMSDLAFLDKSPAAKHYLDGASCMENPFVLPINDRLLEARCLDAVKRMQVEVRCATLSVRAQISPLHGTLRSNQSATMPDLRKWDPAALMNRLHLIPTHTKIGATALDRGLFTEGEPSINGAGTKFSRMGGRYASHLPRSFHSQNSDKPIVSENSSSASQVPEYMFLRRMLKGRIEPKQHVKLKPVVGLPGNPVCGVPISRSPPSAREEFTFDAFKDAAANDTIEDSPTAIIQACNNDQRKARLICEFVGTTTDKQRSLRLSKSLSNEATPRKIYSTDRTSARDLHTNPSTEAKPPEYVNHSAVSDELARERGAKRIQDLIRSLIGRRVSFNVHETKRTRTVDDAMTLFQAHMRGIASRNTSFRDLVAANAGRRRTRVDEAVATALERAIMDEEWDG
ncbi:hypothetical protein AURANDRAFT_68729 [Aureococcus anophagefferens]|uniref:Uncharacterized protein n=1 Tax=Aureococcus anophagefferens TaxID=44056 RepID=F0YQK8_AURAN|nr:hypothetical protein AURANDRAFT_68729 [Aureococcus anophagefferens]EGB02601.1 hypothetical protein AURANDRAFT_68729 [Aureococcus anophagefferens]|eukprot:XP_009042701.1 hypothetical protein AURANDRAFT_68729 [Aureococcus anophagefferens]